jgi:hypothetical protein
MTRTRMSAGLLALVLAAGAALAQQTGWVTVTQGLEGFSIKMPSQPEKSFDEKTRATVYMSSLAKGTPKAAAFGLAWRKRDAVWDVEKAMNEIIDDYARVFDNATVVSRTRHDYVVMTSAINNLKPTTKKSGYPGMEAKLRRKDGSGGTLIVYIDKPRLREFGMCYMVGPEAKYSEEDARRFFDSFVFMY